MGSALVYLFQTIMRNVLTDPPLDNPMNMEAAQLLLLGQESEYVARVHSKHDATTNHHSFLPLSI